MFSIATPFSKYGKALQGTISGDNERFLRFWHEINVNNSSISSNAKNVKWFPHSKGGEFRRWFGNRDYVINWENNGFEIRTFTDEKGKLRSRPQNTDSFFKQGITWSDLTSGYFGARYVPEGGTFDATGPTIPLHNNSLLQYMLGYVNSKPFQVLLDITCPGIHYNNGVISNLPIKVIDDKFPIVDSLVNGNITTSQSEWNSFETSWDFKRHPLICGAKTVSEAYAKWETACNDRFNQLKANEEELNRIFIDIYGLQDELTPEVEDKDVTVRKADLQRDIKSLISYAVGCMFGRYSLDVDGLAYAGGDWDSSKYATFPADKDNIIPICDDEYFDDDIVARFVKFIETVYGKDTLEENLRFIADALGGKGASRDVIRDYFLNGFYADHLKIYQKRPIYWLFSSGKKNGFKALIYMHRYQPDLLARMRTDYVHEQQERYRTQLQMLEDSVQIAAPSERVKLNKKIAKLKDQSLEIQQYEEKIHHLADQMISIDLDDGVKVNYAKFQDVLEKIK